jgi:hypothetical protein
MCKSEDARVRIAGLTNASPFVTLRILKLDIVLCQP